MCVLFLTLAGCFTPTPECSPPSARIGYVGENEILYGKNITVSDAIDFGITADFVISNMAGQQVASGQWQAGQGVNVSALAPGTYLLTMHDEKSRVGLRFVKVNGH